MSKIRRNIDWLINRIFAAYDHNRRITNIFDYYNIIRKRVDVDRSIRLTNYFYGFNYILKRYSGYRKVINASIEHAPGLNMKASPESKDRTLPALFVVSKQRAEFLRKNSNKLIFDIGPSISYSQNIYSEFDIKVIKQNLGKTLCIYPIHSIEITNYEDEAKIFIEYITEIKRLYEFNTVLVSMYFIDIERGRHLIYEQQGWTIVSSGRRENYDFNDCMQTIISISDYAIFQSYASAVGYCIYNGVPVTIFPHNRKCECSEPSSNRDFNLNEDTLKFFDELFADYDEQISREKYDICKEWFGYDSVMSAEEMKLLLEFVAKLKVGMNRKRIMNIANKNKFLPIKEKILKTVSYI